MKLKIWYYSMIVSVLKFLVKKYARGYHIAKDPVHTKPRRKTIIDVKRPLTGETRGDIIKVGYKRTNAYGEGIDAQGQTEDTEPQGIL